MWVGIGLLIQEISAQIYEQKTKKRIKKTHF